MQYCSSDSAEKATRVSTYLHPNNMPAQVQFYSANYPYAIAVIHMCTEIFYAWDFNLLNVDTTKTS